LYQLRNKLPSDDIQLYLFPSLTNFDDKSLFNKLSSIISSPMILLLVITLPVVKGSMMQTDGTDDDEGGGAVALDETTLAMLEAIPDENNLTDDVTATWCRWLTAVQLVGSCLLIGVVCAISSSNGAVILLPLAAGVGLLLSTLFLWTTTPYRRPRLYWMMCFVGFGMAVVWIYIIANEVVSVLQTIGLALGVSEAILGLTVFAVVRKGDGRYDKDSYNRLNRVIVWVTL
jgi:sodium/potassium/calcium exchanger 6